MQIAGRVAPNPVGEHDSTQTYDRLDIVSTGDAFYMAKEDVPANILITNTTYWMQLLEVNGGVPSGGTAGQIIIKNSSAYGDVSWESLDSSPTENSTKPVTSGGVYTALSSKADSSALGTAAALDVATSGDASTTEVVKGDDSRLTDARNAADVSSWAKASTKPSYTASEVGAIDATEKGANGGVAELDSLGKVPSTQLPTIPDAQVQSDYAQTNTSAVDYIKNKPDLSGFITKSVNDLTNYYLKTETYTQTEVDTLIGAISTIQFEVVSTLPTTNIQTNVIYLVPKSTAQTDNVKDEYINLDGTSAGWEKIGDTDIDLSGYVTTSALNTALADYVTTTALGTALADYTTTANLTTLLADKVDVVSGKGLSTNDYDNTAKGIVDGVTSALADKVDKVSGKGLSTYDYDATAKGIVDGVTSALADKVDKNGTDRLMTAAEGTKLSGIDTGAEVNTIESITLNGTAVSPDANKNVALTVITNAVNDLTNYYLKSETYTQTEVDTLIGAISTIQFEVVSTLPTTDIQTNVIYLVPKSTAQTDNVKDEYINLDGTSAGWEKIGDTEIDLSGYVTTSALNTALADYVTTTALGTALADYTTTTDLTTLLAGKVDTVSGKGLSTNDYDNTAKGIVDGVTAALADKVDKNGTDRLMTAAEGTKLSGIETGAEVNIIESVKVNGTALTPDANRAVDVTVPSTFDASAITSGTFDIARIPAAALERCVHVANRAARLALTTDDVQLGDAVKQEDTGVMYFVINILALDSDLGYEEFVAGDAATVNGHTVNSDVPANAVFTDTTYESKTAASGGTDVSLVTTGEKYTWNNKQNALTFDSTPTASSSNPVTSDGINTALGLKVDAVSGKGLSTNDYTTADKAIVDGVTTALADKADADDVGDLSDLKTTVKTNIVAAINELHDDFDTMITDIEAALAEI